jgi:hypothetical protein
VGLSPGFRFLLVEEGSFEKEPSVWGNASFWENPLIAGKFVREYFQILLPFGKPHQQPTTCNATRDEHMPTWCGPISGFPGVLNPHVSQGNDVCICIHVFEILNIKAFGHLNIKFGFLRFPTGIPTS